MPTFQPVSSLRGKNVTSANQFTRADIDALCDLALQMKAHIEQKRQPIEDLKGRIMTPLFFEDSSRTLSSFCAAMLRLGGGVVDFKVTSSSMNKGESLGDTVRTLNAYSDVLVLRHPDNNALEEAVSVLNESHPSSSPDQNNNFNNNNNNNNNNIYENENHNHSVVINGGNGSGEHPTQALLDTLTMRAELGDIDGLTIALIGDLKMGRTVHSLLRLLVRNYRLKKIYLVAPDRLQMPDAVLDELSDEMARQDLKLERQSGLHADVIADCDVLYCTRLQKERFARCFLPDDENNNNNNENKNDNKNADPVAFFETAMESLRIDGDRLRAAKSRMIVMHPLPRVDELTTEVDNDPRCAYFRQMRYGLFMRMAILYSVLM